MGFINETERNHWMTLNTAFIYSHYHIITTIQQYRYITGFTIHNAHNSVYLTITTSIDSNTASSQYMV